MLAYINLFPIHFYSLEQSRFWKVFSQPSSQLLIDGVRCSLLAWLWITSNASEENVWNIIPCLIEEESSLSYPTTSTFNFNFYKMVFLILTIKEKEKKSLFVCMISVLFKISPHSFHYVFVILWSCDSGAVVATSQVRSWWRQPGAPPQPGTWFRRSRSRSRQSRLR